jgi:Ca2+-dependent lipid-binding protein
VSIVIDEKKFVTTTKIGELNPVWNENTKFLLYEIPQSVELSLYDWNETLADRFMGSVLFEFRNYEIGVEYHEDLAITLSSPNESVAKLQFSYLIKVYFPLSSLTLSDPTRTPPSIPLSFFSRPLSCSPDID